MSLLPLKLLITPLLMWIVSIVGRRWGGLVGGLVAGMPLTSGPISVYLALEQGASFAAQSATGALIGIGAVMISYAVYAAISVAWNTVGSAVGALIAYALTAYTLFEIGSTALSIVVSALAFLTIVRSSTNGAASSVLASLPSWDLPARMAASTTLVVAVTGFAGHLGPSLSGLFSPIPVIAWPLLVFAHTQGGQAEALATIRGTAAGCCGIVVFNLLVAYGLEQNGLAATYALAFGLSCLVSVVIGLAMRRRKPHDPQRSHGPV